MQVSDLLTLDVTDVALGGKAIARHDGRVIFVDRGVPGDRVRARLVHMRRRYAEARLESIETPSDRRVVAPCPHFERCGGCRFQDLPYPDQLALKQRQVLDTLVHLGGIADPVVGTIVPAPETLHYRNKMEFSFHPDPSGRAVLGLHERGTFDRVFELETCLLPSPLTVQIVRATQRVAAARGWRAYHPSRHEGLVRYLTVRHLPLTDQCAVHLVAATDDVPGVDDWATELAALSPAVRTVTLQINRSRANVAFGDEARVLRGDGTIVERLLGLEFETSANAFLQTNSVQAERLYAATLEAAAAGPEDVVLDLYCGTGTLTLMLARTAREAIGVESVEDAVAAARRNARRNGIENVRFECGEARPVMRQWSRGERPGKPRPAVVVVDPPRAGLHPRVVFRVAELAPRRVVYVSCNPATLARDLKDFADRGYRLVDVTPFDLFPHTPHVECLARLEPKAP